MWRGALSAQDIRANMEQQVAPGAAGLLGYWQFNAVNGSWSEDASGKGNHGQLGVGASIESGR